VAAVNLDVSWWDLAVGEPDVEALQADLSGGGADAWRTVPGLRWKVWIADRERRRWGAVMLWNPARPPADLLPANRAAELIGRPPSVRERFSVATSVSGIVPGHAVTSSRKGAYGA
jgi:hypothetical protein